MNADERELITETAARLFEQPNRYALVDELVGAGLEEELHSDDELVDALMTLQGRAGATSTLLSLIVSGSAFDTSWTAVLPLLGTHTAPGLRQGDIAVDGLAINPHKAGPFLVHTAEGAVLVSSDAVTTTPANGIDPELGLHTVIGTASLRTCTPVDGLRWDEVEVRALRAVAHELIGLAERALGRAVEHVTERKQFGKAIGAFQVVQHRLVDANTALAAAKAVVESTRGSGDLLAALAAKAWAGRAAREAVDAAQQFCGAMGFTWEFGLHELVRRITVVEALFGDSDQVIDEIGDILVGRSDAPRLATL
ncbi:acyl-CoA dehydrogenase family protein [Rhodococcus sp. NPDC059968]|uniref:acyl-CoA dehydrogenase family protein n=1 Tax=Rhodococcus sp. NPDC059968 TaxID=3347017 RepID=UPI00366D8965